MLPPLVLAAAVAAFKLALARLLPGPWLFSDATLYAGQAQALAEQGWAALRGAAQDYTILYPLLLAPVFAGASRAEAHQAALALNAVLSTSTLLPLYWIARRTLPAGVSGLLVGLVALLPPLFVYALALSAENLFVPLFWWGTFFLLRMAERDRTVDAVAAGLLLGLLPAVKLTGFAILPAAAVLVLGMVVFQRVGGGRAAACLAALVLPQVAWVLLRQLLGGAERGLFGFGPGVGEALVAGFAGFGQEGWGRLLRYFLNETTYVMAGAYGAWIAFAVYLVTQYRTWRARSVEGLLLLWTFLAASFLALVTVLFLFPISQSLTDPEQRAREIYGRFIEVLFPAFFILGTRGMLDFAWKERSPRAPGRELFLILALTVFTAMSLYPLTSYAASAPLRGYAFEWLGRGLYPVLALLLLVLAVATLAAASLGIPRGAGWGRRAALGCVLCVHAAAFAVTIVGVVRGARVRDAALYRGAHWLERRAGPRTRIVYDTDLGYGDQYFAYRFWSEGTWEARPGAELLSADAEYVVTPRALPLPLVLREGNGLKLYRGP